MSTTHTAHSDQASLVAARMLIPASLSLAGSVLFVGVVSFTLDPPRKPYEETNSKKSSSTSPFLAFLP